MKRLAGALLCALVLGTAAPAVVAPPASAADSRAVVVIDTGQGSRRAVISFSGTITGIQALELAGGNPVTYGFGGQGAAVCAVDGVGHEATGNSCLGTPSDSRYWAYFRVVGGANGWSYSNQSACSTTVRDGDVEGWRFGTGQQPPFSSFCAVVACAPPPTEPPIAAPAPAPGPGAGGTGNPGAPAGGSTQSPEVTPGGTGAVAPGPSEGAGAAAADPSEPTTVPGSVPTSGARDDGRTDGGTGDRTSALGVPRVADDGGSGSPWGVIVAVVVVGALALLAFVVRRRRSTA